MIIQRILPGAHPMRAPHLALLLTLFAACGSVPENVEKAEGPANGEQRVSLTRDQYRNANIATGTLDRRSLGVLLPVQGVVDVPPQNMVSISAPLGGYLRSTDLLPGMEIQKGRTLAVLEDPRFIELQQDYLVSVGKLRMLEQEHARQQALNATKTSSDKVLQEAATALNTERITQHALAEQLQLIGVDPGSLTADNISRTVALRSPIHGWVAKVNVNIGRYVQPTDVLFELVDPSDIHLALTVFEKDLPNVREGQEVHARPTAHPNDEYEAEVILLGRSLDNDRSTVVHCHFTKTPRDLVPGMAMSATLESRTDSVWCVPSEAIVNNADGQAIFLQGADSTFTLIPVRTGAEEYGFKEIIEPSDEVRTGRIVLKGAYTLLSVLRNKGED